MGYGERMILKGTDGILLDELGVGLASLYSASPSLVIVLYWS